MKGLTLAVLCTAALAVAGTAAATLVPGVYDPGNTGCVTATYSNGVLHLAKNCVTSTNAAAGADITGQEGQAFASAEFTLASKAQCQGGSPRFDIVIGGTVYFLGCNNVAPTINADGSATYVFTAATIAAGGNQVPVPSGAIQAADVLIDVQGTADLTNIKLNGVLQVPAVNAPSSKDACKNGGWKTFTEPKFKNQGDCVSWVATGGRNPGDG